MEFNDQDSKEQREKNPPVPGSLVPYHFVGNKESILYNGVRFVSDRKNVPSAEDFGISGLPFDRGVQPCRCCVYPSYSMHDDPYKPGVLLVGSLESAVRGV
ncbi:hypothetical protein PG988_009059 [Apiospora saccharicola]